MNFTDIYFHCSDYLKSNFSIQIAEIKDIIRSIRWAPDFQIVLDGNTYYNQAGYNKALEIEFLERGWEKQPLLKKNPKLIGDFRKHLIFVEVQFGNSATLFRDYYKFQYGLANGLLSLAVLIVPTDPQQFFPTRPNSVNNMAEFSLAKTCLSDLPINVPTLLIGLHSN